MSNDSEMMTDTDETTNATDTDETTDAVAGDSAAPTGETAKEKATRIGGRVRAFNQVDELLQAALKTALEKSPDSEVVSALQAFAGSFDKLRNPPPKRQRDGSVRVAKFYFVGWTLVSGKEERIVFTARPTNVEFVQENGRDKIQGPYASRATALMLQDLGYIPQPPAKVEESATQG